MQDPRQKALDLEIENSVPSSADEQNKLLDQCPQCSYLLEGLPTEHHCPECGLIVDRRWQVFGGRTIPKKSKPTGTILEVFLILIVAYPVTVLTATALVSGARVPLVIVPLFTVIILGSVIWLVFRKPRCFVAIGPKGLAFYLGRDRFEEIAWTGIGRAQYDIANKRINIARDAGDIRLPVFKFFGMHIGEVDRCVQGINHYPRPEQPA